MRIFSSQVVLAELFETWLSARRIHATEGKWTPVELSVVVLTLLSPSFAISRHTKTERKTGSSFRSEFLTVTPWGLKKISSFSKIQAYISTLVRYDGERSDHTLEPYPLYQISARIRDSKLSQS